MRIVAILFVQERNKLLKSYFNIQYNIYKTILFEFVGCHAQRREELDSQSTVFVTSTWY